MHRTRSLHAFVLAPIFGVLLSTSLSAQFRGGQGDGHHESSASATAALPLTILSLHAEAAVEDRVDLRWVTEDESDTETMTVERSADGTTFHAIGNLPAAGDAPGQRLTYTFTDPAALPGTSYYRLRVTDFDGSLTLSSVVSVNRERVSALSFSLYPNPTNGASPTLLVPDFGAKGSTHVAVYDLRGRQLAHFELPGTGGPAQLPVLHTGTYQVQLQAADGTQSTQTLVVTLAP